VPDWQAESYNLYSALQDAHVPADWVDETDLEQGALGQFKVIYVTTPNLSSNAVAGLQSWTQTGGVAVFTAGAGQFDQYDEPATWINSTLGIDAAPHARLYWPAYTNRLGSVTSGVGGLSSFTAIGLEQPLSPTTASTAATFASSGQPAVTLNVVGLGKAIVFGTFVGTAYEQDGQTAARDWVRWPVTLAGVTLPVDFTAPNVEAATLESPAGLAVTLLNWTDTIISNLALTVRSSDPISRVDSARLGTTLAFSQNGETVSVTLPVLGPADVLKLYSSTADSVGDGIPDLWRQQYFGGDGRTTNGQSCAACDPTHTGQSNLFKYVAGLDPTNSVSVFWLEITPVAGEPDQKLLVFGPVAPGRTYTPWYNTDLTGGLWLPLVGYAGPVLQGDQATVTDLHATESNKFYHINISLP